MDVCRKLWLQLLHGKRRLSSSFVFVATLLTTIVLTAAQHHYNAFSPLNDREITQLEKYNIIPNYISMPPDFRIEVVYRGGTAANFGNLINENRLKEAPQVLWDEQEGHLFTLLMINPDRVNDEPVPVEYLNWLIVNIKNNNVSTGQTIFKYEAPKAIEAFPRFHSYVFLLYHQGEGRVSVDRYYTASLNRKVSFRNLTWDCKLKNPSAINFYRVYEIYSNPDRLWEHRKGPYDE